MELEKQNILFVLLDTVRADYLDIYSGRLHLPWISSIAKKGVVYENAVAPSTYTAPSHASLFLGKRVKSIKTFNVDPFKAYNNLIDPFVERVKYLDNRDITLAAKLRYLGYETALFSNNPFLSTGTGLANGFEYVSNIWIKQAIDGSLFNKLSLSIVANKHLRNSLISFVYGISRLIPKKKLDRIYVNLKRKLDLTFARKYGFYKLDAGARNTNREIEKYVSKADDSKAKFIFINYMEGHEGYPTNLVTRQYEQIDQEKWLYLAGLSDPSNLSVISKAYEKRLLYLDSKVKELVEMLRQKGFLDNAVLVLASDHGQAFGEHGMLYHNMFPFEEIVHVPLIAAKFVNGKQVSTKERVSNYVSLSALHQSLLDIGSMRADELNSNLRSDRFVFSDHVGITEFWDLAFLEKLMNRSKAAGKIYYAKKKFNTFATAVYYKNFKLILYKDGKAELYDKAEDPEEKENIISKNRSMALEMLRAESTYS